MIGPDIAECECASFFWDWLLVDGPGVDLITFVGRGGKDPLAAVGDGGRGGRAD